MVVHQFIWNKFLTLVTNHYNLKNAAGALLGPGMPGGPPLGGLTAPEQTFQRGFTPWSGMTLTLVVYTADALDQVGGDASKEEKH